MWWNVSEREEGKEFAYRLALHTFNGESVLSACRVSREAARQSVLHDTMQCTMSCLGERFGFILCLQIDL